MLKHIVSFQFVLACILAFGIAKGQNSVSDFVVEYKVYGSNEAVNSTDGDFLSYGFKGTKMHMSLINKMVDLRMIYDDASGTGLMLNSMQMGTINIAVELTTADLAHEKEKLTIEPLKGTKRIAGYKCIGAKIITKKKVIEVWYSTKLSPYKFYFEGYYFADLDGFPLLVIESNPDGLLTSKATKVILNKIEESLFETIIPNGYELKTFEQLNGGKK